ncbi:unnamed protein product, partial [Heterosigma akashiwo]
MTATIINNIKLVDSYNFVGSPLASFTKIFSLNPDLAKGYFPHCFARVEHMTYEGPIPSLDWYDADMMKSEARDQFLTWHEEQVEEQVTFNFMDECLRYCS